LSRLSRCVTVPVTPKSLAAQPLSRLLLFFYK